MRRRTRIRGVGAVGSLALLLSAEAFAQGYAHSAVALAGETAPGTGGGTYATFGVLSINASGDVVFVGNVFSGTVSQGMFLDSGGADTAVALEGNTAPGTGGGTYETPFFGTSINVSRDVAFGVLPFPPA